MRTLVLAAVSAVVAATITFCLAAPRRQPTTDATAELAARLDRIETELRWCNARPQPLAMTATAPTSRAPTVTGSATIAQPAADVVGPTSAQLQAADEAARLIDGALSTGAWHEDDRERWRSLAAKLDEPTRQAMMQQLIVGMNDGRLRPRVLPPL